MSWLLKLNSYKHFILQYYIDKHISVINDNGSGNVSTILNPITEDKTVENHWPTGYFSIDAI